MISCDKGKTCVVGRWYDHGDNLQYFLRTTD